VPVTPVPAAVLPLPAAAPVEPTPVTGTQGIEVGVLVGVLPVGEPG